MIQLTRIRHSEPLYLNPDRMERIEEHADTTVRMENGNEYIVCESAAEIVDLIIRHRAEVLARSYAVAQAARSPQVADAAPDAAPHDGMEDDSCPQP
jgi:uncharacterized protein YlzI (FlbEa/FlbD family)